jgi:hypothetical protein
MINKTINEVFTYETDDGRTWPTLEAATKHVEFLVAVEYYKKSVIRPFYSSASGNYETPEAMLEWLLLNKPRIEDLFRLVDGEDDASSN